MSIIRYVIVGLLVLWSIGILITIALLLRSAPRIVRRGAAFRSSLSAVADDPFFYPFGEMPTVPADRVSLEYGRGGRMRDASDFRAWGIPELSGLALRSENGGRVKPAFPSAGPGRQGPAVVLTFPKRSA